MSWIGVLLYAVNFQYYGFPWVKQFLHNFALFLPKLHRIFCFDVVWAVRIMRYVTCHASFLRKNMAIDVFWERGCGDWVTRMSFLGGDFLVRLLVLSFRGRHSDCRMMQGLLTCENDWCRMSRCAYVCHQTRLDCEMAKKSFLHYLIYLMSVCVCVCVRVCVCIFCKSVTLGASDPRTHFLWSRINSRPLAFPLLLAATWATSVNF